MSAVGLDHCTAAHHCLAAFFNSCKSPCPACCQYRAAEGWRIGNFGQFERGADRVGVDLKPESKVACSARNHDALRGESFSKAVNDQDTTVAHPHTPRAPLKKRSRSRRRRVAAVLRSPGRAVSGAQLVLLTFPVPLPEFSMLAVKHPPREPRRPLSALQRTRCRLRLRWKYCSRVRFRSRRYLRRAAPTPHRRTPIETKMAAKEVHRFIRLRRRYFRIQSADSSPVPDRRSPHNPLR